MEGCGGFSSFHYIENKIYLIKIVKYLFHFYTGIHGTGIRKLETGANWKSITYCCLVRKRSRNMI